VQRGPENDYDAFAAAYARDNERSPWNAHDERPAMLQLVGDAAGQRILDAGCGAGALSAALVDRGAEVVGIDRSSALLQIAVDRLAGRARFQRWDLRDPLPFDDDGAFDVVVASLVMHYLEDWSPTLREFRRVLAPDRRLIISTHHPFMDHALASGTNYFRHLPTTTTSQKNGNEPVKRCRCASGTDHSAP
jgi:SAM-dependent methyltransferase